MVCLPNAMVCVGVERRSDHHGPISCIWIVPEAAPLVKPFMHSDDVFPIERSDMYQELMAERAAIEAFRQAESQRVGYEIDTWRAEWLWWANHQRSWRTAYVSGKRA